eukprot:PRCOL_00001565-RA
MPAVERAGVREGGRGEGTGGQTGGPRRGSGPKARAGGRRGGGGRCSRARGRRVLASRAAAAASVAPATRDMCAGAGADRVEGGLTEMQAEFKEAAAHFGAAEFFPNAAEWDAKKHFPKGQLKKAAELGFAGMYVSEDVGGLGASRADAAVVFEELASHDVSTTAYLTIHNMCAWIIDTYGSAEQRERYLPAVTQLDAFTSYCLTEPGSGSDAASLSTSARRDAAGGGYILSGAKAFISGGGASDLYVVMARTGGDGPGGVSCFVVEAGSAGLSFGANEKKMGWNSQPTAAMLLDDVRVGEDARLGAEGEGFRIAMSALDGGRVNIAACSVGGADFCVGAAKNYAADRKQFGKSIASFQNTQFKLADMQTSVQASRLMVRAAAEALDSKDAGKTTACAMAKRFATDTCYQVANDALQLHGGYGFLADYAIERYVRDLRVHTLLEGTNEVMRLIIAKRMLA